MFDILRLQGVDPIDVLDLTRAEIEGREQVVHAMNGLRHSVPGFEQSKLRNFGMTLGIRDSRKIIGRHNLTSAEVRNQAKFDDSVGIFPEFIDGYNILILPTSGRYFQVRGRKKATLSAAGRGGHAGAMPTFPPHTHMPPTHAPCTTLSVDIPLGT